MIFFSKHKPPSNPLLSSQLFNEKSFFQAFNRDLEKCEKEVIIESPYITKARMKIIMPIFERLLEKEVLIYVITRNPKEHDHFLEEQSEFEIRNFEAIGVHTLLCPGNHHRKLAILDRNILWEGSLNILSQTRSREIMRRIESHELAEQMFNFLNLGRAI